MKKNLRFLPLLITVKKQIHFKNLLFVISFFISSNIFSQNPVLLKSPIAGGAGRDIYEMVSTSSGKTFFSTVDRNNHFSDLWGLWTTDGTQAGTVKLNLIAPGYNTTEATLLTPLGNDKIVFAGNNEGGYGEVWVSDGTQAGTFGLEKFNPGGGAYAMAILGICSLGTDAIYAVKSNNQHGQLRKTNGNKGDAALIYDFGENSSDLGNFKNINNIIYFSHNVIDGGNYNTEIWRTDGTTTGTYLVKYFGPGYGFGAGGEGHFMSFKNNIYFITVSSIYGDYLWKSDGTDAGTNPLKQISTSYQSDNANPSYAAVENNLILANNLLYFTANDGAHGKELWKTDGTEAGTVMTFDFYQGSTGSNPYWLTVLNNQLYFSANSSFFPQGTALYFYNGSQFSQPIGNSVTNPSHLTVQNNTILFTAVRNTNVGNELWATDGGTANTIEIANINPVANASSNPSLISVTGSSAFFAASFDANGDGIDDPCIYKYTAPEKIWTGSINSDPSNIDNWFPSGVPASTDNVLLSASSKEMFTPLLNCKDLYNNGGLIDVRNGFVMVNGNFFNTGIVDNSHGGIFAITTAGTHTIGGTGAYNGQFTISGGADIHLVSDFKVNDFKNDGGAIYLGPYNFQYDTYSNLPPNIITDGNGYLTMQMGTSPTLFTVGTDANSYTPVTLTNHGDLNYFNVNVKNGLYTNGYSGNTVTQQAVNKTWTIEPVSPGTYNVDVTLQWNASDELPGFDRNNVYLNHFTLGTWDSGTPGMASGTGPFIFTRNGFTSLSPFSISSSTSVLPVTLILFNASKLNNTVQINWQTTSEINASFYAIERSADGAAFSKIGQVSVLLNNAFAKNYSYIDAQPLQGVNYYRLKMTDADGKFTYSKIVAVKMDGKSSTLQIYPNPAKNILNVQVNGNDLNEDATLQIIDISGRKVKEERINLKGRASVSIDITGLSKGTYNVLLKGRSLNEQEKFVKE